MSNPKNQPWGDSNDRANRRPSNKAAKATGRYDDFAFLLTYASAVTFLAGLFLPAFRMLPRLGGGFVEQAVQLIDRKALTIQEYSLLGGIWHLILDGDLVIGALIFCFTVLFPALKLAGLGWVLHSPPEASSRLLNWIAALGKWSMLDVLVLAVIVVSFKGFPGGSRVELAPGAFVFGGSVVLSLISAQLLKQRRVH